MCDIALEVFMNHKKIYKYFYLISILMICAFVVLTIIDYSNYNPMSTSAPFYVNVLLRAIEFVFPAFVFACVGYIFKKKNK